MLKPLNLNTGQVILVSDEPASKIQRNEIKLETIDNKVVQRDKRGEKNRKWMKKGETE